MPEHEPEPEPEPEPELPPYCCVILADGQPGSARIFVEQRGADADVAASRLTCWGGKRETGEAPLRTIVRECEEEMGWSPLPQHLRRAVDLYVDGRLVAWFFETAAPGADEIAKLSFEPGRGGAWVDTSVRATPCRRCVRALD